MVEYKTADPAGVMTGPHFLDGDHACTEGALAAGCRFVAGYPITPSTEVVERIAARFPLVGGGLFIQMEDELAASITIQGACWAGKKVMTVSSGPGFTLMMEHIGLAAITELPCVFVDVQRTGPSTGLPTQPGQADMMQARWGSHGDYEVIALCPQSPQECFDLTIEAFNLAETYRNPVMLMMDECVGHMTEKVVIPEASDIQVVERRWTKKKPGEYLPFEPVDDMVPDMCKAGDGHKVHVTGLTHDYRGYPTMTAECQEEMLSRVVGKIRDQESKIRHIETEDLDDAEVVVLSYGITARVAMRAIDEAKAKGIKVGRIRLIVAWPFPEEPVREIAEKVKAIVVPEMNFGQMSLEVERVVANRCKTVLVPHAGGAVHEVSTIVKAIEEAVR
jgi:2-oxoglutarate/2-oxoacid ferredoxin oxidoreductase subunit alpha